MYTVKCYVKAMGGQINVKSVVNQGSSFILTLPFIVDNHTDYQPTTYRAQVKTIQQVKKPELVSVKPSSTSNNSKEPRTTILIVEDNFIAVRAVLATIKRHSQNSCCDVAETGYRAIKMANAKSYDFILMDIGLPDISGIEAARQIRIVNATVPIIALTGHANDVKKNKRH